MNLLFTSSGGMHAQKLFYLIKKKTFYKNIKIHAVNSNFIYFKNKKVFHDSFTKISKPKNKNFLNDIKKIVKNKNINILFPGSDEEAIKLSLNKKKINTFIPSPEIKKLKFIYNKFNTLEKLKKEKLIDIKFDKVSSMTNLKNKIESYNKSNTDFVIKPIFSRGGRNVIVVKKSQKTNVLYFNKKREVQINKNYFNNNQNKFLLQFKKKFPVILMERMFEPNLDIDILSWKGKLIKYVIRQRIGFQASKGSIILKPNNNIKKLLKKITKLFNLTGIYDCDFMFDKQKTPILIELNPRISGSLYASISAGAHLVDDLISLKINRSSLVKDFKLKNKKKIYSKKILN